ncbi:hypothetical protein C817_01427 [Dorea sp. 5-2]|nr:hypothetical protein C817_01427 [Dorea sp. 5-2]
MIWPFENDTSFVIKKLADRSFRANKMRNVIAIIAIALTAILFTSLFTLGIGVKESTRRANMILSGGDGHAKLIHMDEAEYETISGHPLVKEIAYCRKLADSVDNEALLKRLTLFEYYDEIGLKYLSIEPTSGHMPIEENEVITDTATLDLLDVPHEIGEEITLTLTVHNQQITRSFVLAGWWESYPGVNYGTIAASKAYVQAHTAELTDTYDQDHVETGTITALVKFENDDNIENDLETVLKESGYSSDVSSASYINAAASPLYTSSESSTDRGTNSALVCALLAFLLSGYLIIYNIFQISILRDLHFYGMLKTIGATGRQINAVVRRQAGRLSLVGIPIGLLIGFFIGKLLLPSLMVNTAFSANAATVSPHPLIFIGAAMFAWITVQVSTRKPARIASKVSPIEAIRYTDSGTDTSRKKKKRPHSGHPARNMAWANLGRNKKRTVLVILSLSVSIILTNMVFTFSHSVDPAKAIKNMMDSDFCIGQSKLFDDYNVSEESALSESYITAVQQQEGFEIGGAEYGCIAAYKSETTKQTFNQQDDGSFSTHIYGLDPFPFSQLQLVDGELDTEKLGTGEYVLEGAFFNTRGVMDAGSLNHAVGDRVELVYDGNVREFTVLGHVAANETNTYDWVGSCFFLPGDVYKLFTGNHYAMSYKFDVADEAELDVDTFLKDYTTDIEPVMTYKSKNTIMAGVKDIQNTIAAVGGTLSFIIGFIGVLNFANTILTSIFTRRRELAILQSIGMTNRQIRAMLCMEGCNYALTSGIVSAPVCFIAAFMLIRPVCENVWFLDFKVNLWPLLIVLPLLFLIGMMIPYLTYRIITGKSVVERLK